MQDSEGIEAKLTLSPISLPQSSRRVGMNKQREILAEKAAYETLPHLTSQGLKATKSSACPQYSGKKRQVTGREELPSQVGEGFGHNFFYENFDCCYLFIAGCVLGKPLSGPGSGYSQHCVFHFVKRVFAECLLGTCF